MAAIRHCRLPVPAAAWFERMVHDLWGHDAIGGSDQRPWLDHGRWPISAPTGTAPGPPRSLGAAGVPVSADPGSDPVGPGARRHRAGGASASWRSRRDHRSAGDATGLYAQGHAGPDARQVAAGGGAVRRTAGGRGDGRALDCLRACDRGRAGLRGSAAGAGVARRHGRARADRRPPRRVWRRLRRRWDQMLATRPAWHGEATPSRGRCRVRPSTDDGLRGAGWRGGGYCPGGTEAIGRALSDACGAAELQLPAGHLPRRGSDRRLAGSSCRARRARACAGPGRIEAGIRWRTICSARCPRVRSRCHCRRQAARGSVSPTGQAARSGIGCGWITGRSPACSCAIPAWTQWPLLEAAMAGAPGRRSAAGPGLVRSVQLGSGSLMTLAPPCPCAARWPGRRRATAADVDTAASLARAGWMPRAAAAGPQPGDPARRCRQLRRLRDRTPRRAACRLRPGALRHRLRLQPAPCRRAAGDRAGDAQPGGGAGAGPHGDAGAEIRGGGGGLRGGRRGVQGQLRRRRRRRHDPARRPADQRLPADARSASWRDCARCSRRTRAAEVAVSSR